MTLRDLIDELTDLATEHGDTTEVRLAIQPRWAFEYSVGEIAVSWEGDDDSEDPDENTAPVVFIGEGQQLGYLGGEAAAALGWGRR